MRQVKLKVLVIHEQKHVRRRIYKILCPFDFEFIYAFDGLDGLAAAKYDKPDLIITDVDLSILHGLSMAGMLKRDAETTDVPIIFLNNEMDFDYLSQAKDLDAKGFLMTPYIDNSLACSVRRAINKPLFPSDRVIPFEQTLQARQPILKKMG